jgi:hypothetical protein
MVSEEPVASRQHQDVELAAFLRSRRQRLRPEDVGLPSAGRRRTPGLRREEVAVLAGVSTTWYTYMEQGRGREVSPSVLDSVARVLRLTEDERRYMHLLAFGHVNQPRPLHEDMPMDEITELLRQVIGVTESHPYPVYMLDHSCNLISWNEASTEWYDDWGRLAKKDRNLILWMLTEARARQSLVEWEEITRDAIARWRADIVRLPHDKEIQSRLDELRGKSEKFAEWWNSSEVLEHRVGTRLLRHQRFGVRSLRVIPFGTYYEKAPVIVFHFDT